MTSNLLKSFLLTVLFTGLVAVQTARADQSHMDRALDALQKAKFELSQAERDKGGHRTKAEELVNHAIEQVNLGIEAGSHH